MEPNDIQLHVLTNFQIFIPLSGDAETIVFTQTTTPSFGLTLTRTDTQDSYHYQFQILHISSNGEEMISNGLAWAKRTPYHFQKKYNTSAIEALICRLKISTGVFDFRRNKDRSIRLVVRCFSKDILLSTGISETCKVRPKKRAVNEELDEGNVIIPISWLSDAAAEDHNPIVAQQNEFLHSSPDEDDYEDSIMANFNDSDERYPSHSIEGDSDDLSPIQVSNTRFAISEFQPIMPNDQSDQYMVLYNGNAEVIGNFRALNFYKASDVRIKEDVRRLGHDRDPRAVILQIDGVEYKFKDSVRHTTNKRFVGYIAQQIESVVPEAVQLIDGILHVDYESLIPYLSESIKQNFKDINDIKSDTSQIHQVIDMMYKEFVTKECQKKNNKSSYQSSRTKRWIIGTSLTVLLLVSVAIGLYFVIPLVHANPSPSPNQPTTPTPSPSDQPTTPESPSVLTPSTLTPNVPSPSISPLPAFPSIDQEVLVELYNATGGGSAWKNTTLPSISVCDWPGVTCNNDFRVISIIVRGGLVGTIPDSIGRLDKLETLDLSFNRLSGTIPATIGNFTNLAKLFLEGTQFTGTVPLELFSLTSLKYLTLNNNLGLSWTIPPQISNLKNLQQIEASSSGLHGTLPNEFSQLSNLTNIDLSSNNLTGTMPGLENTSVILLRLSNNQFSGSGPKLNGNLVILEKSFPMIMLKNNFFSGEFDLPSVFLGGESLRIEITDNQLTSVSPILNNISENVLCSALRNPFKCPIPANFARLCKATCK